MARKVSLVIPEEAICAGCSPRILAQFVNDYYGKKGVDVLTHQRGVGLEAQGDQFVLSIANTSTKEAKKLSADAVLAGIGIVPNTELAQQAGLKVDNGIHVDSALRHEPAGYLCRGRRRQLRGPHAWASGGGSNTKTTRTPWADRRGQLDGRAKPCRTIISPTSIRTCSTWATKPSANGLKLETFRRLAGTVPQGRGLLPERRPRARRAVVERLGASRRGASSDCRARAIQSGRSQGQAARRKDLTARRQLRPPDRRLDEPQVGLAPRAEEIEIGSFVRLQHVVDVEPRDSRGDAARPGASRFCRRRSSSAASTKQLQPPFSTSSSIGSPFVHERQRSAGGRFGGDVQHDCSVARAAHPRIADADDVGDSLLQAA